MIDIHAHILPGVDDGPATWAGAIELCRQLASQGVTEVVATPHFFPGRYPDTGQVLELTDELNKRLRSISIALTVYPGAEAYLVPELPQLVAGRHVLTLNNAGRYLLVELPFEEVPICVENVFFSLMLAGVVPVIAHPERNAHLREDPSLLVALVERGALVQINAGSLAGEFGHKVQKQAENLVHQGLVQLMGSDAHCSHKRPPLWPLALPQLQKLAGKEVAHTIAWKNPLAVLSGNEVALPSPGSVSRRESNFWGRALAKFSSRPSCRRQRR